MRIWRWLAEVYVRKDDSAEEKNIKRFLTPVALLLFTLAIIIGIHWFNRGFWWYCTGLGIGLAGLGTYIVGAGCGVLSAGTSADIMLLLTTVCACFLDAGSATMSKPRNWSLTILVLDAALILNRVNVPRLVIPFVVAYLAAERAEAVFQYGLYDAAYWGSGPENSVCNCPSPPCQAAIRDAFITMVPPTLVFLVDFYFTRTVASELRQQIQRMKSSVEVAEYIADALARYDIDGAEESIKKETELPRKMAKSFMQLLFHLRSYKAYLPQSCLVVIDPDDDSLPSPIVAVPRLSMTGSAGHTPCNELNLPFAQSKRNSPSGSSVNHIVSLFEQESGSESSTSSPSSTSDVMRMASSLRVAIRRVRVSLAAGNMLGYLSSSSSLAADTNTEWIAADVERWCAAVLEAKGVVDVISGDRRYASFNARQACPDHASAAVGVLSNGRAAQASSRGDGEWSGCVAMGQAICGDFGSASVLRFMVLGGMASSLYPFERTAAQWRLQVLTDGEAYSSACYQWQGELLGAVFVAKRGSAPQRVYSIDHCIDRGVQQTGEWMYVLADLSTGRHEKTNEERAVLIKQKLERIKSEIPRNAAVEVDPSTRECGEVWRMGEVELN
eukprot:Hpha_TRINITY_DN16363_c4_g1::TRINITY_DN16363_c4_g1_i1::g.60008::m.60008